MLCLGNESVIVQIECFNIFKDFQFVFIPLTFTLKWFILIPQESNYHNFHWNQFSFCSIFCIIICYPFTYQCLWMKQQVPSPLLIPQESNYHNFHWNQFSFCSIFCIIICYPFTYQCLWMKQQVPSPLSMPPHLQHHEGIV